MGLNNILAWARTLGYHDDTDYTDAAFKSERPSMPASTLPEGYVSEHFRQAEFTCNHCGKVHPTNPTPPEIVLEWLENIRSHFGDRPVIVNSGYRCLVHNTNVGGATHSQHMKGTAVDFSVKGVHPYKVYEYADKLIGNKGGVGKYSGFTHIDCRGTKARW